MATVNTLSINALGIFGKLETEREDYFKQLQDKYSHFPKDDDTADIFRHLTLVFNNQVLVGKLSEYIDLLRVLKAYLPFKLDVSDVIIIDGGDVALAFDIKHTQQIRDTASKFFSEGVISTHYTKVVRFVPKHKQEEAISILRETKAIVFNDFVLCANRLDDSSTIYSSKRYK